jgi:hypothetical protein
MTNPAPTDGLRWRGYSHADLYKMLHDGPGPTASAEPSRRWGEIAATLTEVSQDLKKALELTGAGWTGPAAGAAYSRLATTVAWANTTGTSAAAMRVSVEDQAGHIAKARAEMPKPSETPAAQPDPTVAPAVQVLQAQTDAEPAEAAASSAEERAVEVMTAYETSTNGTTGGLATFSKPEPLLPNKDVHNGRGGGLLDIGMTVVSGLTGGGKYNNKDGKYDGKGGGGGKGGYGGTYTSGAPWDEPSRKSPPVVSPGRMSGVSTDPFLAAGPGSGGRTEDAGPRRGNVVGANPSGGGSGSGGSGMPGGPKSGGFGGLQGPELQQAQQAAAASQAAAGAHPGAGAPIAPGAGGPVSGQEKMAMRRFGMEAIGSSQWFGDTEEPVPGQSPKRRFDLRDSQDEELTESVSILDEEHKLPPGVIGEGGR